MEAKLNQEIDKNALFTKKNRLAKLWMFMIKPFDKLSKLEIVVFLTNTVLLMIMFGSGISTMIHEATNFFPIHPLLMYPIGFILMGIVVMATHIVTKLSAELVFSWSRYNLHYKVLLPATNLALIILCWSVQSEGGELMSTADIEAQIALINTETSSSSLKQVDESIIRLQHQLATVEQTISTFDTLQAKRKGNWLRDGELNLLIAAQSSQQQLSQQITQLTTSRISELNSIRAINADKIKNLKQELTNKIQKGRSKAGLAEGLLVFISFFMMAYKHRFRTYEAAEAPVVEEFPKGLKIEEREEMLPNIKPLAYDEEDKHLLIEYQHKQYYFDMESFMNVVCGNRRKYDKAVEKGHTSSRNNKLKNLAFYEKILVMTGLSVEQINLEFNYKIMNEDWFNTSTTTCETSSEVVENRIIPLQTA